MTKKSTDNRRDSENYRGNPRGFSPDQLSSLISATPDGVALRVKAVPGASRTLVAGVLGDRLKITLAAPPEAGQANRALCELLAKLFDLPRRDVQVTTGQSQPGKTVELVGINLCAAVERLQSLLNEGKEKLR